MKKYSILLVLLVSFFSGCYDDANVETLVYEGYISDQNGDPVQGVNITVYSLGDGEKTNVYNEQSNSEGYYKIVVEAVCSQGVNFYFNKDCLTQRKSFYCPDNRRYDLQLDTSGCP